MEFRRSGQRDERRRRVLRDEPGAAAGSSPVKKAAEGQTRRYHEAALPDRQPRITDLIPTRPRTLVAGTLLILLLIGGIEALYYKVYLVADGPLPQSSLVALDVAARGSLAAWFGSTCLFLSAVASVVVYTLRRHRVDDYRGRYRIWVWAAAGLLIGSVDATTVLHQALDGVLAATTGVAAPGLWSVGILGGIYCLLLIRMLLEISQSRGSTAVALLAGTAYAGSAILHLNLLPITLPAELPLGVVQSGLTMLGHAGILGATSLFARFVLLDAQGRIPVREPRRRAEKDASSEGADAGEEDEATAEEKPRRRRKRADSDEPAAPRRKRTDVDSAPAASKTSNKTTAKTAAPSSAKSPPQGAEKRAAKADVHRRFDDAEEDDLEPSGETLSKAERRRQRKLKRRQKQEQ